MPEYVSIKQLAQDERIFINGKPRNHQGLIQLLRRRFKLNTTIVRFPGQVGPPVAAITKEQAEQVIKSLTSVEVVGEKETTTKQDD